jgi:hypothetical protein
MIVSVIALIVALGGTGYATTHLDHSRGSRPTAAQTKLFKQLAKKIEVANAANAVNAKKLDHLAASAFEQKSHLMFASINPGATPTIAHGSGVTSVKNIDASTGGFYAVTFDRRITNCTWIATAGPAGNSAADTNIVDVRGTTGPRTVAVVDYESYETEGPGQGFHILVACP